MRRGARGWLSALVWGLAALAAAVLWLRAGPGAEGVPALVDATPQLVAPLEPCRLAAVLVVPGDEVEPGQVVARLDSSDVETELEVAQALLEEYVAEIEATAVEFTEEMRERRLSAVADLARARAELAEARGRHAAMKAEATALASQLDRMDGALRDRLALADRVGELRARQESLVQESQHTPASVRAWSEVAHEVEKVLQGIRDDDLAKLLAPIRARVSGQARLVSRLSERREARTLRSPIRGRVTAVLRSSGDNLVAGEPVIRIVPRDPDRLTAYLPQERARGLKVGDVIEATLRDRDAPGTVRGVVERLGPEIVLLPEQLWTTPEMPRYGRPVHIRMTDSAGALPGEIAYVHPRSVGGAHAAPPSAAPGPQPIVVPDALLSKTRLEPSGAVWVPELERLLVVSDDTGRTKDDEHLPYVFMASADGRFDPEVLPIEGVDRVSDLEAITRAPDGRFYLVASQSRSSKGKRPEKRQWLLRARLEGRKLVVTGRITLYDALERGLSAEARVQLGIGPSLDIEGAAWRGGELLLGLKAPADQAGRAVVWRLADVDGLLDRGRLPEKDADAGITRLFEIPLPTGPAGAPGGISDLLLEGDRLYLLSTLPDGPPSGAAWRLDLSKPDRQPERLGEWSHAKPEALARTGDGRLVVLFDGGDDQPSRVTWLQDR